MVLYKLPKQQIGNHLEYRYRLLLSIKDNPLKLFIEVGPTKHVFVCLLRLHNTKSDFRKKTCCWIESTSGSANRQWIGKT